jgi:hypothetical protein
MIKLPYGTSERRVLSLNNLNEVFLLCMQKLLEISPDIHGSAAIQHYYMEGRITRK